MKKLIMFFADWQDRRSFWLFMGLSAVFLEQVSYWFFQKYLYMRPCEQCVYIRFAMFCIAAGGFVGTLAPKRRVFKIIGYALGFYGVVKGIRFSVTLARIHAALRADDPFGVQGCSAVPSFAFGLPLQRWFPGTFSPTGECGYDSPVIPIGEGLDVIQKFFTDLYAGGWYLIPKYHFMNMAQASFLYFIICLVILAAVLICKAAGIAYAWKNKRERTR